MSTTVELVRANERYARLRAAVEGLADEFEVADWSDPLINAVRVRCAEKVRALLAAVDS